LRTLGPKTSEIEPYGIIGSISYLLDSSLILRRRR
jgi:hypothetical protein